MILSFSLPNHDYKWMYRVRCKKYKSSTFYRTTLSAIQLGYRLYLEDKSQTVNQAGEPASASRRFEELNAETRALFFFFNFGNNSILVTTDKSEWLQPVINREMK